MLYRTMLFFLVSIATGGAIVTADDGGQRDAGKTFLVLYRPGPNWDASKRVWEQELGGHKDYLIDRYEEGALQFAGPFTDDWGGGVVVRVADAQAAATIAAKDPAVLNGVFVYEIHPWYLVDWDEALDQRNGTADSNPGQ